MSYLELRAVAKRYGPVDALTRVDLTVAPGTLTAVLGPSGCGKTTLLRCVAGFEHIDAGSITVDGRTVAGDSTHLAPHRRKVAIVPQESALFPHLSVRDNVAYGLDRATRRTSRVHEVLTLVGLADHGDRMPHQLSGGQQQRIAVARALAPRPALILLDEPFSSLDAALRADLRDDIRAALRADGATAVLVTHDQGEALSVADQVAVMRAGAIVQAATPADIYHHPTDPWTAAFIGDAILLTGQVHDGTLHTPLGAVPIAPPRPGWSAPTTTEVDVMLRPEQIRVGRADEGVPATVETIAFHGHDALITLRLTDAGTITARVFGTTGLPAAGALVGLRVEGTALTWATRMPVPVPTPPEHDRRRPVGPRRDRAEPGVGH
ncbi:Fe(3+) ions import ATP-binding protein FbpC [Micromonospora sp. MW-13]|uniref:ABC transporter ATP-binding protein n=1 Tax=Micromonospora sp. MW-13 TaxID=2094022 RepID=UPI000E44D75B|nr:ABC transporter ATP-binding protein [Micromonospora sp. MW-13]RGC66985.1 Fe(3+) ions import ATP-binding protein FbpC [Micromonospora sp. MW-13]